MGGDRAKGELAEAVPRDERVMFLDQLERRRAGSDAAMWQAPALTVTAQAFLLQVLSNQDISAGARLVVLAAGVLASLGAIFTLIRGHAREVQFSESIEAYLEDFGLPTLLPDQLPERRKRPRAAGWRRLDGWLRDLVVHAHLPHAYLWWAAALAFLIGADLAVFLATT